MATQQMQIFPHKKEKANIFPTIREILGPIVKGASRQVLDKNTLQSVLENWARGPEQSSNTAGL